VVGLVAIAVIAAVFVLYRLRTRQYPWRGTEFEGPFYVSPRDDAFLEDLSRRGFMYFWEQADPQTGLVADLSGPDGLADVRPGRVASIASTGFSLTAIAIAAERHWIDPAQARQRVRNTLRFFAEQAYQQHGFFYHFMDAVTGERRWASEVSSIDTALLLAGVLTVRQAFHDDPEIVRLANDIYNRVDFTWMLNGSPDLLSHGWYPQRGFITYRWDHYSELMLLYLLAIGSPTHAITPASWYAWDRHRYSYEGYHYVSEFYGTGPLFIYQYSQAWVDFRHRADHANPPVDYFLNSIRATRAQRLFCISLGKKFPGYSNTVWGITASDSAAGYRPWGGPPGTLRLDGTVVPCAPGGSLMFAPDICLPALRSMLNKFGGKVYHRYGFVDAFNPNTGWISQQVIGIDIGITLVSAENLRTGSVWRWFMANPEVDRAMNLAGFVRDQR
jgi:hypothetical protein